MEGEAAGVRDAGFPEDEAVAVVVGFGDGLGLLAFEALHALYREARAQPAANWRLTAPPAVLNALRGPAAPALHQLEARLGRVIAVAVAPERDSAPFDIAPL